MAHKYADGISETTTWTSGAMALSGARTGYKPFSSFMSVGDTTTIEIRMGSDFETGKWEYTATNELTRVEVYESTNSNAAVSWGAGSKVVSCVPTARELSIRRELLNSNRTYYVRPDGSDSGNDGLTNTSGGAFLTLQKAMDTAAALDLGIYNVIIEVADGTYTAGVTLKSLVGAGYVRFRGNTTTPGNVVISITGAASSDSCVMGTDGVAGTFYFSGFKFQTTTAGSGFLVDSPRLAITIDGLMEYGAIVHRAFFLRGTGGTVSVRANYTISGGQQAHVLTYGNNSVFVVSTAITVTLSGTPNFSLAFIGCYRIALVSFDGVVTWSGSATGKRYDVASSGLIDSSGQGTASTWFPGNSNGTTATQGQQI